MNGISWIQDEFPDLSDMEPLARSSHKYVLKALHPEYSEVIIKVFGFASTPADLDLALLKREFLEHPSLPTVYECDIIEIPFGHAYWTMEKYIEGIDLAQFIKAAPLSVDVFTQLGSTLFDILRLAESQQLVHRNIKPDNIILSPKGQFVLTDFGITKHLKAAWLEDSKSQWGRFTAGYAPPEQYDRLDRNVNIRCDMFACGVTLFESVEQYNPFTQDTSSPLEILKNIETLPWPIAEHLGNETNAFLAKLTQTAQDQRPQNFSEILSMWQEIISSPE